MIFTWLLVEKIHRCKIKCSLLGIIGRKIRYEALQSEAGKKLLRRSGRAPDDISSVVLVEQERYIRYFLITVIREFQCVCVCV